LRRVLWPMRRFVALATPGSFYSLLFALGLAVWLMSSALPQRHLIGDVGWVEAPFLPVERSLALGWMVGVDCVAHWGWAQASFWGRGVLLVRMWF
jgi:hypothetical protein